MNTKLLMIASAIFMGLLGIALNFIPGEILKIFGQVSNGTLTLTLQVTGALYIGFAMTNWMAKTVLIGGIYARPLCIGNFFHFFIAGLTLVKATFNINPFSVYILIVTIIYVILAILFGYVFFTNPVKKHTVQ